MHDKYNNSKTSCFLLSVFESIQMSFGDIKQKRNTIYLGKENAL